jgi:16S rRNA G966 N2-methylase RsmD
MDLVLLDPPFDANLWDKALRAAVPALSAQGCIYLESPHAGSPAQAEAHGLALDRHLKAGAVHAQLLRRAA